MSKNMKRWISMLMAACLLVALSPAALPEATDVDNAPADEAYETFEAAGEIEDEIFSAPAEDASDAEAGDVDLSLDEADAPVAPVAPDAPEVQDAPDEAVEANGAAVYAWTLSDSTGVYRDDALTDRIYTLKSDEAVLVAARAGNAALCDFNTSAGPVEGYIAWSDLEDLTPAETENLLNEMAAIGDVALYEDDINRPLPMAVRGQVLAAADFTRISNSKEYVVQGKTIKASMVGNYSDCWSWARALYKIIWGVKFGSDYVGDAKTGYSLIRNLSDSERQLTGANLKRFMKQSVVGCTLRICSCPRTCSNINKDGCPKHEKHSLMVVEIREDGFVVMDNMTGNGKDKFDTRYYTYDNFAKHWAKYKMVKYIKWPNAPEYDRSKDLAQAGVKPESVTLSETSLTLRAEQTQALTATVLPENAEDRTVTWSSSDPFVAYVDKNGSLVAVASGTATITAAAVNGVSATLAVTVVPKNAKATKVSLDQKGTVYLNLGTPLQLKATLTPTWANPAVAWKSSKKKVATVSSTGLVTPVKTGTATITVTTASKKTAKIKVKVLKANAAGKVSLDQKGTVKLNLGETLKLNATVSPASAKTTLKWKSSKKKIATVSSDGTVTPVKAGTTTIAVATSNKKVAKVKVKVVDPNAPTKVTLDQTGTVKLSLGQTLQLTPALSPATAQTTYKWKSSKKKIATVSSTGLVTPVKVGITTIAVATANKKVARVKVKVVKAAKQAAADTTETATAATGVKLNKSGTVTLKVGKTLQLKAALTPATATTTYQWKTTNAKVASISAAGKVTALKAGTCTVGVQTANGKTATVKIKVTK